jgi:hypothetical protein
MGLQQDLKSWDGKSKDDIETVFFHHQHDPDLVANLILHLSDHTLQAAASWLLKRYLESGQKLNQKQIKTIYSRLPLLEHWQAKLHILQCMSYMPIDKETIDCVYPFLRTHLTDDNKFVRAWSYHGFYELARQHPEYYDETRQYFDMALQDEAPSVRARIRNIFKQGFL